MMDRLREMLTSLVAKIRNLNFKQLLKTFFLICSIALLTVWFSFPVDAALEYVRRATGGSGQIEISFADAWMGLGGPTVSGLEIKANPSLSFDQLAVRPRAATLWLRPGLAFKGDIGGGVLSGDVGIQNAHDVHLELDAINVLRAGLGAALPLGLTLSGDLSGTGDFIWSNSPEEVSGELDLHMTNVQIFGETMPLPSTVITLESVKLKVKATAGLIEIAPLTLDGDEIWGNIRGTIKLNRTLSKSKADLKTRLHFNKEIEGGIGPLLPMAGFRKEKDAYIRQFRGPLSKMKMGG